MKNVYDITMRATTDKSAKHVMEALYEALSEDSEFDYLISIGDCTVTPIPERLSNGEWI